jgi:hypothetical protein
LFHGTRFRLLFSSGGTEWFGTEFQKFASIFVPRNGVLNIRFGPVQNEIPRVCFWNLLLGFSVPRNSRYSVARNKPFASSIPSSAKLFLIVFVTTVALKHIIIKTVILFIYVAQDCAALIFFRFENNPLTLLLTPAKNVADVNFRLRCDNWEGTTV